MDKERINNLLKRKLSDGARFNQLIDKPTNQTKELSKGDTFHTVKMMKIWAETYYKQTARLAPI